LSVIGAFGWHDVQVTSSSKKLQRYPSAADDGYPVASVAVDPVVLSIYQGRPIVVLWRRTEEPFPGDWALPGAFMDPRVDQTFEAAARRALRDKVGVQEVRALYDAGSWHREGRDPRGWWVIVIAFFTLMPATRLLKLVATRNDLLAAVVDIRRTDGDERVSLGTLDGQPIAAAFDHVDILQFVFRRIWAELSYASDLGLNLLPEQFTLRELQEVHETLLGEKLNKPSFRRGVTSSGLVIPTDVIEESVGHRPATLYRRGHVSGSAVS
jgi:8-oxo-dGTP diphosphatase